MKKGVIYDLTTGNILRSIAAPDPELGLEPEERFLEVVADPQKYLRGWKVDPNTEALVVTEITTNIMDVVRAIQTGASDKELDEVIEKIPDVSTAKSTVSDWKAENYSMLRYNSYPPIIEFIDTQVKINSGDLILVEEGQTQLQEYVDKCLAIKTKYKKPNNLTKGA